MSLTLSHAVFWIAVVACVVAQLGILRATRPSPSSQTSPTLRPSPPAHRPATRAEELAWAVLPAVALALVLVLTWRAVYTRTAATTTPATPTMPAATTAAGSAA